MNRVVAASVSGPRMQRVFMRTVLFCVLPAALTLAGCWLDDDCDVVVSDCVDICDTYCNGWGCWTECFPRCNDRCVDVPDDADGCTRNGDCALGYVCQAGVCQAGEDDGSAEGSASGEPGGGLCEPCDKSSDCADGALCLQLDAESDAAYCGRLCSESARCPVGYECLEARTSFQCVPQSRVCDDAPVLIDP